VCSCFHSKLDLTWSVLAPGAPREQQLALARAKAGIEQQVADVKAELVRRQRKLDDAKHEMNLTIEAKVEESLAC